MIVQLTVLLCSLVSLGFVGALLRLPSRAVERGPSVRQYTPPPVYVSTPWEGLL